MNLSKARARVLLVVALAAGLLVAAVAIGQGPSGQPPAIGSAADAIAAARNITSLREVEIDPDEVWRGRAVDLIDVPWVSVANERELRERQERHERPAWRVELSGVWSGGTRKHQLLVFDAETGELIFSRMGDSS